MEWPKLKNIIILILLAANLFLLAMAGVQERDAAQHQEQAVQDALAVLERNGIKIAPEAVPHQMELSPVVMQRDRQQEDALAQTLLGDCAVSDLGGGRYSYESVIGSAEFRSNGNFSITLSAVIPIDPLIADETQHALTLTEQIGLRGTLAEQITETDGKTTVVLYQMWQNIPVYSCRITLQYQDGALCSVSGQRLLGEPQPASGQEELLSVPTVLIRSLNGIHNLGDICSEITQLTPGYQMANPAEGTRMEPVWYIVTDTGAYQLNAITGVLVRA